MSEENKNDLLQSEEVQKLINDKVGEAVAKLEKNNGKLLNQLQTKKEELNSVNETLINQLSDIEGELEIQKVKSGEINVVDLLNQKVEKSTGQYKTTIESLNREKDNLVQQLNQEKQNLNNFKVESFISNAATKNKNLDQFAIGDVVSKAKSVWNIDENGNFVAKDGDQELLGKNGNALEVDEWINSLSEKYPYYFKQIVETGANGSKKVLGGATQMTKIDYQKQVATLPEKEKNELMEKRRKGLIVIV